MNNEMGKDTAAVMDVVRHLAAGMIAGDTAALDQLLDEHYTLTHITGYVQSKAEWLHEVARESMKYYSVEEVTHTVKVKANTAAVTIRHLVDASIWGSRHIWPLQQTIKLENRNGQWIILRSVASTF